MRRWYLRQTFPQEILLYGASWPACKPLMNFGYPLAPHYILSKVISQSLDSQDTIVEKEKGAEAQSLQKAANGIEKKLRRLAGDRSTLLIRKEVQHESRTKELQEKKKNKVGLE